MAKQKTTWALDKPKESELVMWEGRKVMMCLPAYQGIEPQTHFSLFANYAKYGPERLGLMVKTGTLVDEARNHLTHDFLKSDAIWSLWGDHDIVPPIGNINWFNGNLNAGLPIENASMVGISRLMSHPEDKLIVGALYYGRHEFGQAQCHDGFAPGFESFNSEMRSHTRKGLIPQPWVAVGFARIHRSVFEQMKVAIDNGLFPNCEPHPANGVYGYWSKLTSHGEDVAFGNRCAKIGIQSYLDPELECLHGSGQAFFGSRNTRNK